MRDLPCTDRLPRHLDSRLEHLRDLTTLADVSGGDPETIAAAAERADLDHIDAGNLDELREAAQEAIWELPLDVSTLTVFRIDLSTGGPADWLEVFCIGTHPACEPGEDGYEVERIVYHFADWFDHAEQTLDGEQYDAAEQFALQVVPQLVN